MVPYRDVGLVDIVFAPFLGNKEHPVEKEESASVLRPQNMKGSLQDKLSAGGQVWTLPVDQKRLDLLQRHKVHENISIYHNMMIIKSCGLPRGTCFDTGLCPAVNGSEISRDLILQRIVLL